MSENPVYKWKNIICWGCSGCLSDFGDDLKSGINCDSYGFPQRPRVKKCKCFDQVVPEYNW